MAGGQDTVLRHGTADERIIGSPQIGSRFETSLLSINVFPEQPYEVNFVSDRDVVTISFGLCTGSKAYDTDKRSPLFETPNTAYFHPAGSEIYVMADRSSELLCFAFDPALRYELIHDLGRGAETEINRTIEDIQSNYMAALAPVIRAFLLNGVHNGSIEGETLAITFFENLLQNAFPRNSKGKRPGLNAVHLQRVLEYIETHLSQDLSLKNLSTVANMQLNHFIRAFKQATGSTPHQYILDKRIARAQDLLKITDSSISQIAYALGFSSQAHFTSVFGKQTGLTPYRYRIET